MTKLGQWSLMSVMAAFALSACTTEDGRPGVNFADFEKPRGLGELCDDTLTCDTGLTCFNNTCTPDRFAAACTPNPCGDGVCNARGPEGGPLLAFCRCPSGEEWNGTTCAMGGPSFPGSITDTTCPAAELAPGVPDETTADCPANSFCTASASGDCLELFVDISGEIGGNAFGANVMTSSTSSVTAECIREYVDGGEGDSDGIRLVVTGTAAAMIAPGASSIVIDISNADVLAGGSTIIWPQASTVPDPQSDAGFGDVMITSTSTIFDYSAAGIGGSVLISSVSGPDADDDDLIDDGEGAVGGEFFIGFDGGDFITGAFTVECGDNDIVAAPSGS